MFAAVAVFVWLTATLAGSQFPVADAPARLKIDIPVEAFPDPFAVRLKDIGKVPPWLILLDPIAALVGSQPDARTPADLRRENWERQHQELLQDLGEELADGDPFRRDAGRAKWKKTYKNSFAKSTARIEVPDAQSLTPYGHSGWRAEETLSVPLDSVVDGVFVFARAVGSGSSVIDQRYSWTTRTGLGWKWAPVKDTEFVVRGGPMMVATDNGLTATPSGQRSQFAVEVLYEMPVYRSVRVEYYGSAVPAFLPADRDRINQDVRFALPLTRGGEFHLGANYTWEGYRSAWTERSQIYVGLEFKR